MKIPYGVSNFGELRREGYIYVDKTHHLPELENLSARYLLFLRPRRFGKSLFLSLLEHYYDMGRAEQFDALFSGLWIRERPTPERGRYLVLSLDFSMVATEGGQDVLRRTFFGAVRSRVLDFLITYQARSPDLRWLRERLDSYHEAETLLADLMSVVRASGHRLYVLIDEYDNFANRLLAEGAQDVYSAMVERTGFVRSFYATLKTGTGNGAVSRMFITGVSPLLLDDLSSGFNIAAHVSDLPRWNALAGFSHADVERAIDLLVTDRPELMALPGLGDRRALLDVLERYYDGYRFSPQASERVFNSDMVLYYLRELLDRGTFPPDMLDLNVRTDYCRLQRIGLLAGSDLAERRALLEGILAEGGVRSELVRQFGVRSLSSQSQFISLLYYLGMLTLGRQEEEGAAPASGYRLEIPNRVIRELQWEHLAIMLQDEGEFFLDKADLEVALRAMAVEGDIAPFLALFHERVVEAMGLKDLRRLDERSLKLMLLAFISLSRLFHPLSEKEFAQGFCDLFLGVSPIYRGAKFAWLLELKYLPTGAKAAQIERAFAQAAEQVARYASDERLVPLLTRGQALKAGSLVFVGARRVLFRPWPPEAGKEGKPERGLSKQGREVGRKQPPPRKQARKQPRRPSRKR